MVLEHPIGRDPEQLEGVIEMRFVNLTPHALTLRDQDGVDTVIGSDGVARVDSTPGNQLIGAGGGFPAYAAPTWGQVVGLPSPLSDTIYIVSAVVAERCKGRPDVFRPGTGPDDGAIRENGHIVAVTRLIQAPQA
jgi:hypothetical protein